jgi:FtsH-binding integral membrane protein
MSKRNSIKYCFAIFFLFGVPALAHFLAGEYYVSHSSDRLTKGFWAQYPISLTIPFLVLAILFLVHCALLKAKSQRSAYSGAIAAWLVMMGVTVYLIAIVPTKIGPTGAALTTGLTPFFYIPFLVVPYLFGALGGGILWNRSDK